MRATVLVDNIGSNIGNDTIQGEWGLSFFIEYGEARILLDAGQSALFAENARKLGLPLEEVDYAVLSHAHYDHADGMETFFERNSRARLYLREGCRENCYRIKEGDWKYIGIREGFLRKYRDRLAYVSGDLEIVEGVWLLSHRTPGLEQAGRREKMFLKEEGSWVADCFAHEQSLVFETPGGIVVFNSCSHGGADTVISEAAAAFPGRKVRALIGGFHLHKKSEKYVREISERIRRTGVEEIFTGHCTGDEAYGIMREELGDRVHQLRTGLQMEF